VNGGRGNDAGDTGKHTEATYGTRSEDSTYGSESRHNAGTTEARHSTDRRHGSDASRHRAGASSGTACARTGDADLIANTFACLAPSCKVLTVVRPQVVRGLAETATSPLKDDLRRRGRG
jgi:hypothetical protein